MKIHFYLYLKTSKCQSNSRVCRLSGECCQVQETGLVVSVLGLFNPSQTARMFVKLYQTVAHAEFPEGRRSSRVRRGNFMENQYVKMKESGRSGSGPHCIRQCHTQRSHANASFSFEIRDK